MKMRPDVQSWYDALKGKSRPDLLEIQRSKTSDAAEYKACARLLDEMEEAERTETMLREERLRHEASKNSKDSTPPEEADVSTVVQKKLMRSKAGWIIISICAMAALLFAIWSSLPDNTKERIIDALFEKKPERAKGKDDEIVLTEKKVSRERILSFDGYNQTKTQIIEATDGWEIVPESVTAKGIEGESAAGPVIAEKSPGQFTVQIRLNSSLRGLVKRNGWATVRVNWTERPLSKAPTGTRN